MGRTGPEGPGPSRSHGTSLSSHRFLAGCLVENRFAETASTPMRSVFGRSAMVASWVTSGSFLFLLVVKLFVERKGVLHVPDLTLAFALVRFVQTV